MVEQMPTFPGGTTELMRYIGEHLKYPTIAAENGTQGKVICRFVVGKDGQVRDVTIARSLIHIATRKPYVLSNRCLNGFPENRTVRPWQ